MKKVLVTGGAGFIGSHIVENLLSLKFNVIVLDNLSTGRLENLDNFKKSVDFIKCDLSDYQKLYKFKNKFEKLDYVIHLSALADIVPSIENPYKYFESNVLGTLNLLKILKLKKIKKFLYAASSSCYGLPNKFPTNENEVINPMYPYALTKRLGEEILLHWSKVYKFPFISLRLFNVYGTRSRTSGTYGAMFGVFLAQKLKNKPFTVVGNGKQTRDFTYVTDVADAFIAAMKSDIFYDIFNVGSNATVSVNKITDLLGGKKLYIPKRPGEPDCTFADISKIKKKLNWYPKITIEDGVSKLLNNINYWKSAPLWTPKKIDKATKSWFKYLNK